MPEILAYVAGVIAVAWGIAHLMPTTKVVAGFGALSHYNRLILTMEWVAEGLALGFLGLLAVVVTLGVSHGDRGLVYGLIAAMLLVMAAWTAVTGARGSVVFFKLCPAVKSLAAALLIAAAAL